MDAAPLSRVVPNPWGRVAGAAAKASQLWLNTVRSRSKGRAARQRASVPVSRGQKLRNSRRRSSAKSRRSGLSRFSHRRSHGPSGANSPFVRRKAQSTRRQRTAVAATYDAPRSCLTKESLKPRTHGTPSLIGNEAVRNVVEGGLLHRQRVRGRHGPSGRGAATEAVGFAAAFGTLGGG